MKRLLIVILAFALLLSCAHAQSVNYTTRLAGDVEIYRGPGYAYGYAHDVGQDGVYTIVEEAICEDGYLWGKLKSGAGWVMLKRVVYAQDSYTVKLGGWVPIYKGPGYDYSYARDVGEDGVYTIIEERLDAEGNVWGRLKSGAGWVDLTYVRTTGTPVLTANFADRNFLYNGGYLFYTMDDPEEMTMLAFKAHEELRNVRLSVLEYDGDSFAETDELYSFKYFCEDTPFVAGLVFWGDMTVYGLSFTDEAGGERCFAISLSGRDGSIILDEYVP